MPATSAQIELLSLSNQELTELVQKLGEPRFRAKQLADAIFRQRCESLVDISTLPASLKSRLAQDNIHIGFPKIEAKFQSVDGTVRYLMAFADGQSVETVWMPEGDFGEAGDGSEAGKEEEESLEASKPLSHEAGSTIAGSKTPTNRPKYTNLNQLPKNGSEASRLRGSAVRTRATICASSQVGCAVNCQFCLTALLGVKRNLAAGEIVGQVLAVLRDHSVDLARERVNIVFMGMGEPFLNYDNFMKAVRLLVEEVGFPESRMTVSTSGIVPRIIDFGHEPIDRKS